MQSFGKPFQATFQKPNADSRLAGGGSSWLRDLLRALERGEATRSAHLWARHVLHRVHSRLLSNQVRPRQEGKASRIQVSSGLRPEK